jgi:glucosylceramidase
LDFIANYVLLFPLCLITKGVIMLKQATAAAIAALCLWTVAASTNVNFVLTAEGTSNLLTPQPPLHFAKSRVEGEAENSENKSMLSVNRSETFQEIEGFGGAFTDSASHVFSTLTPDLQEQLLDMYFGEAGLRYNMGRLTIGSCDFSMEYYNYDDEKGDVNLTHFNISHDEAKIIPFILRAMKKANRTMKFVASPWSAPAWMKKNNHMNCDLGPWTCVLKDDAAIKTAWANYFAKYIDGYKSHGVDVWGITIQNEPEAMTGNIVYEGMHYTPQTEKSFLKSYLGPVMKSKHPDVNILIYDHNKDHIVEWANEILSDPETAQYVWGTAFHWYTGPFFENLAKVHSQFPQHKLLSTESTVAKQNTGTYDKPEWHKGEHYGREIIGDLNNWSTGFIDWNLLLDKYGAPSHADPTGGLCEKLIKCGSDSMVIFQDGKLYPQVFYYYMGHVSKFVPAGSVRVGLGNSNSAVLSTAFKTPEGKIAVVAMNQWDGPAELTLRDSELGETSTVLPPHSIATFTY